MNIVSFDIDEVQKAKAAWLMLAPIFGSSNATIPPPVDQPPSPAGYDLATHGSLAEGYAGLFPSGSTLVGVEGGPIDLPNTEGTTPYGLPRANDGIVGSGFCLDWEAVIIPPADGLYQFRVAARPGGHVILDGQVVWSDAGQTNGWIWDYFEKTLTKGQPVPISALCMASRSGGCGFQLRWRSKEAGIHGTITDEADVAGYASEKGYSDIDTFYLRPPADWRTRLKTYVPPPVIPGPQPEEDIIIPPLIAASYWSEDFPDSFFTAKCFEPWGRDISALPVDPLSDAYMASLASLGRFNLQCDFGPAFGIPRQIIPPGTPMVDVTFEVAGESDSGPWPIPMPPLVEGGGDPNHGDVHWNGFDQQTGMLYAIYNLYQKKSDSKWYAYQGTKWDLSKGYDQRPLGWTSEDASGNALAPLLACYQNYDDGKLQAIRGTVGLTQKGFCQFARHFTNKTTDPNVIPMGAFFRMKSSVDVSQLGPQAQWVAACIKKHGIPVQDNGSPGKLFISGTPDARWNVNDLGGLKALPPSSYEVIQTGDIIRSV